MRFRRDSKVCGQKRGNCVGLTPVRDVEDIGSGAVHQYEISLLRERSRGKQVYSEARDVHNTFQLTYVADACYLKMLAACAYDVVGIGE